MRKRLLPIGRMEALEPRSLMAVTAAGAIALVNGTTPDVQSVDADAIAFLTDSSSIAAYFGRGAGDHDGVFVWRFDAQGAAIGSALLVNATAAGRQSAATVASLSDGAFIGAWEGRGTNVVRN